MRKGRILKNTAFKKYYCDQGGLGVCDLSGGHWAVIADEADWGKASSALPSLTLVKQVEPFVICVGPIYVYHEENSRSTSLWMLTALTSDLESFLA